MPSKILEGKVAIVTGAASGLGADFAVALAQAGAAVGVGDIVPVERTCSSVASVNGRAYGVAMDVTDPRSIDTAVEEIRSRFGRVDILVNNAGIFTSLPLRPFSEIPDEEWVMRVNVWGSYACAAPLRRR